MNEIGEEKPFEIVPVDAAVEAARDGLINRFVGAWQAKYGRFIAAAALGSIPWVGGVLSAAIALQAESGQEKLDEMQKLWLKEHEEKISKLNAVPNDVLFSELSDNGFTGTIPTEYGQLTNMMTLFVIQFQVTTCHELMCVPAAKP